MSEVEMLSQVFYMYKTVNDIPSYRIKKVETPIQAEKRRQLKIGVVDDQHFDAGRNLKNLGFEIDEIGDIKSISEISEYPIVLCDLMDVGVNFDRSAQGAGVIKEIRKNYPQIFVIAYSGSASKDLLVQKASHLSDGFIKKDADMGEWCDVLDSFILKATDPREVWHRLRIALVKEGIDTKDLLRLEDAYVRSYRKGDDSLHSMKRVAQRTELGGSAKRIVESLVTSAIFKIMIGN
jgi:CheY-like chemotaxis protein